MRHKVVAVDPPKLSTEQWQLAGVVGVLLVSFALCQVFSFQHFTDSLQIMGLSGTSGLGVMIILMELWGAACCFRLKLSSLFRLVSATFMVLVTGLWLEISLQALVKNNPVESLGLWGSLVGIPLNWLTVAMLAALFLTSVHVGILVHGDMRKLKLKNKAANKRRK